jgi:TPP-dependent pyruvate/acetoin dehydrogenase alpha subunit
MSVEKSLSLDLYKKLLRCRYFDEVSLGLFEAGLTPGRMHSYIGEEAIAVGSAAAMDSQDLMVSTHRGGAHLVAKDADMRMMFAEYMGRSTGYSGGKGGPMHFSIPELGFLCTNGIVGSGIPLAVGAAMACKRKDPGKVVVCYFGDGAANTGSFHEGLNMAAIWNLPVVFICENNGYAETLPVAKGIAVENISLRASGYGLPGITIDGNDTEVVYEEVSQSIDRARAGKGPSFIEAKTYRIEQHFSGESNHYRDDEEIRIWKEKDPLKLFREMLCNRGLSSTSELDEMESGILNEVESSAETAKQDPFPESSEAFTKVYADWTPAETKRQ